MRRLMIMGPPGSGKSRLARRLGERTGLPVFHLDRSFWRPGWVEAAADEFRQEVERIAALPAWIIDGNYAAAIRPRLDSAEALIYLDVPCWRTLPRILRRTASSFGRSRSDLGPGCPERLDLAFIRFAWTWNRSRRQRNLATLEGFGGRTFILRRNRDVERLIRDWPPVLAASPIT